jgi:DNA-binding PadR family transcriptional regulator
MTTATRKLGERQGAVLRCLRDIGLYPGGGWYYANHSTTVAILDSLVKRGLVEREQHERRTGGLATSYRITDAGREAVPA